MQIDTLSTNLVSVLAANTTNAAFAAEVTLTSQPVATASRGVFVKGAGPNFTTLVVVPFGTATGGQTGSVKVLGWSPTLKGLWVPQFSCEVACTFDAALPGVGAAGVYEVSSAMLFARALSLTNGIATLKQGTTAIDTANFLVDASGVEVFGVEFKIGTCTDMNALVRFQ